MARPGTFQKGYDPRRNTKRGKLGSISDTLKRVGQEVADPATRRTRYEEVIRAVFEKAIGGDIGAIQVIFDRLEGKPMQRSQIQEIPAFEALIKAADESLPDRKPEEVPGGNGRN